MLSALKAINWEAVFVGGLTLWLVLLVGSQISISATLASDPVESGKRRRLARTGLASLPHQLVVALASLTLAVGIDLLQNLRREPTDTLVWAAALGALAVVVPGLLMIGKGIGDGRTKEYSLRVLTLVCAAVASSVAIFVVGR